MSTPHERKGTPRLDLAVLLLLFGLAVWGPASGAASAKPAPVSLAGEWGVAGAEPAVPTQEAKRLRRLTFAYLTHLYGPRAKARWRVSHRDVVYELQVLAAWIQPALPKPRLWLAVGGVREGGGHRYEPGLLQLLVLGFDPQGRLEERSRSPWIQTGDNGGPPHVHGLLKVGADRHAFVTSVSAAHQGFGVTVYELRAPKGAGFQHLGTIRHHDYQGHESPVWTEGLELASREPSSPGSCWPLVAERHRTTKVKPPQERLFPARVIPCSRYGTYGRVELP
jgi:hypothetical protein